MSRLQPGYYTQKMSKLNMIKSGDSYMLRLDFTPLGIKLDQAQDALDAQVWEDVQRYMPLDTGNLIGQTNEININERGRVFMYPPESEYGHYLYEGIVYVDPITGTGAFYTPEWGFWSRPGVQKVPSDRTLTYSQPNATAHWGETAYQNHNKEWLDVVKRALS